jgi:hypothetical protein
MTPIKSIPTSAMRHTEKRTALSALSLSHPKTRTRASATDPMLGIMHYGRDGSPAFVFDLMEPERPKVDGSILAFLKSEALQPADFAIRPDRVVRLNPKLVWECGLLSA